MRRILRLAMVHEVFPGPGGEERLATPLREAASRHAVLAALPELPMDRWIPAGKEARDGDAEAPGGARQLALAGAARAAGVALLGGAIIADPASGRRHNTALLFDAGGGLAASYAKVHLPYEPGFWEAAHYAPGDSAGRCVELAGARLGVQICSDIQRPSGGQLLAAQRVDVLLVPRATPPESYARWLVVLRAAAVTSAAFVVSVNRPRPEGGAPIGGPSVAIAPDGTVLAESEEPVRVVDLDLALTEAARRDYPGYLDRPVELYARAWGALDDS